MKLGRERDSQRAILEYLRLTGCLAVRTNAGLIVLTDKQGQRRALHGATPGTSDILACVPPYGRMLAVEGKGPKGHLTQSQSDFLVNVVRLGGVALVARNLDDVKVAVQRAKQPPLAPQLGQAYR